MKTMSGAGTVHTVRQNGCLLMILLLGLSQYSSYILGPYNRGRQSFFFSALKLEIFFFTTWQVANQNSLKIQNFEHPHLFKNVLVRTSDRSSDRCDLGWRTLRRTIYKYFLKYSSWCVL